MQVFKCRLRCRIIHEQGNADQRCANGYMNGREAMSMPCLCQVH